MKKREFNKLLKVITSERKEHGKKPVKYLDVMKITNLTDEQRVSMVHHIVKNRGAIVRDLIPDSFSEDDWKWLRCCGYLHESKGTNYQWVHTAENTPLHDVPVVKCEVCGSPHNIQRYSDVHYCDYCLPKVVRELTKKVIDLTNENNELRAKFEGESKHKDTVKWNDKDTMLRIDGEVQRCEDCGANVFKRSVDGKRARCNGCGAEYITEGAGEE